MVSNQLGKIGFWQTYLEDTDDLVCDRRDPDHTTCETRHTPNHSPGSASPIRSKLQDGNGSENPKSQTSKDDPDTIIEVA